MSRGPIVTDAIVREVKAFKGKYPNMTQDDLAKMTDLSRSTVGAILRGEYDGKAQGGDFESEALELLREIAANLAAIRGGQFEINYEED